MNRLLACTGGATLLLIVVSAFWWVHASDTASDAKESYTHMHCPDCNLEVKYNLALENRPCAQCGPAGARMIPTVGPAGTRSADSGRMSTTGKILAYVTIALVVVQGLAYAWVLVARARRRAADAASNRPLVCRCPFCRRKIGYSPKKIGTGALCARCKTAFTLPADGVALEEYDPQPRA